MLLCIADSRSKGERRGRRGRGAQNWHKRDGTRNQDVEMIGAQEGDGGLRCCIKFEEKTMPRNMVDKMEIYRYGLCVR